MKRILLITALITVFVNNVFSQSGPAGVGNATGTSGQPENIIWLDASTLGLADGDPVLSWPDQSGNGNDLIQLGTDNTPLFETNGLFSGAYSSVRFDGTERYLTLADNADLDNNLGGITMIGVVYNATLDGSARGIYSKRVSSSSEESYGVFTYTGARVNFDIRNTSDNRLGSTASLNTTTDYIISTVYDGSLMEIFLQTGLSGTLSTSGNINDANSDLILGALNENYGTYFDGDIAELIIYRGGLNDAERLIVENYLSEKYNITISNDFFTSGDAAFVNDVTGIGTVNGTEKFSQSGFSDALQITELNGSLNAANEFLILAHDNTAHAQGLTSDITVDPGVLDSHWARSWYIENSGDISAELRFDFGTAGIPFSGDPTDYVLLYRANTSSNYTRALVNDYTVENGDQLVIDASNANLPSGYYTLGQGQQLVPGDVYSYQSGDWNDPLTWTTDPSGALRVPSSGLVPTSSDNVTILSGRTVTMDTDDNDGINLTVNGKLDIVNTSGHDFFNILGGGTISIAGDASNNDNFPSGSATIFADSIVGGTVEIIGTGISLDQNRIYNDVVLDLTNTSDVATLLADYVINGDLNIQNGIFQVNDNSATTSKNITVYGDVQINNSGELAVGTADARHEFNFYGDFNNSGRAEFTNRSSADYNNEATDGIIDANFLNDFYSQQINCNGVTNFYRIEVDKGDDQTYILDVSASSASNFNLFGPADYGHGSVDQLTTNDNAIGLLRGTIRLNDNVDVPVLNNTGNYNISEAARIWVNGGSLVKPSGTAIVPYGTIQLSGGTIDAPINSGITTRANGNIVVSDGIMTVNQIRTSVNGPTNIGGYTQSGGTVNVTGNSISTDYYVFSLTYPGNTFNMSGGILNVSGARTGSNTGGIFIASDEANQSVTGGTVVMEINRNDNFKVTSLAPFWNVTMRYTSGSGSQVDLTTGSSGSGGNVTNITDVDLRVLNNLVIENGITFDHNGFDVEIGSDFVIESGADYLYNSSKKNTTTINGVDNSVMAFNNRTGDSGDEQRFWNLIINKPTGITVSLESGKADVTGNNNNLLRIDGDYFKVLSGTLDQGVHSIRLYADTLINYDELTIFNPLITNDSDPNGENDLLKLRDDGGSTVFITADSSRFGGIKLNSGGEIINLISDLKIDYLEYKHGRMNLGTHNLTIDRLNVLLNNSETRTDEDSGGNFSVEDMFITAGNASDGGLSLYVPANAENPGFINMSGAANTTTNPTVFFFPVGTGTTGVDATSEFTPANIRFLSGTDDGYVTVVPVTQKLATAGPYPLGSDIIDRYWIVDYRDFTTVPKVERMWFRSVEKDDPNGAPDGFPSNFVPGYVLEDNPYTRTAEVNGGNTSTSTIDFTDAQNIRIFFWGNEGSGNPGGGYDLIHASYTSGDPSKFAGAPDVFYNTNNGRKNWNNGTKWTTNTDGTDDGVNDYPQSGDIALMYNYGSSNQNSWVNGNIDISVARLEFDNSGGGWLPRLWVTKNDAVLDLGPVSGTGDIYLEITGASQPTFSSITDIGDFASQQNSVFTYKIDNNSTVTLPSQFDEYPRMRIEAGGGSDDNRVLQTSVPITINRDLRLDRGPKFRANHDVTIKDDLRITWQANNRTSVELGDTQEVTLRVEGDLRLEDGSGSGPARLIVKNDNQNSFVHRVQVGGNVEIEGLNVGQSALDLFNGAAPNNNAVLEFIGEGQNTFTNVSTLVPDLYRIEMNKGSSVTQSMSLESNMILNGATNGVGVAKAIEIKNGNLIINNSSLSLDLTTGDDDFNIPSSGGLQVSQGTANVSGDDSGIALDGSLIIDGGTLNMDDAVGNGNNFIEYSASGNAELNISAGTLTVGSQIRPITTANTGVLKYIQTGGDVRIGTQNAPTGNRGMLQIYNVGSEFTFTGGTLTIERHQNSPTISALYLDPDDANVTSEITIFNANTPAGQSDFRINSFITLSDLTINGDNNPSVEIRTSPLTIDGLLLINSGATLNGNGITLTINGDFENNGTYNAQSNETIFDTDLTQEIRGSGTNNFFRFTKTGTGSLELTNSIEVDGLFTISDGTLNDNGFDITLNADAVVDGTHTSSGGNGLVFAGSANQELRRSNSGTGYIGGLRINNSNGVTIPDGNGYNFNINGDLQLNGGVFDVGGSNILFGQNADIIPVQAFSSSNMIRTNSSFVDKGVGKMFAVNTTTDFTFPVGQAYYTPVIIDLSTGSNTSGSTAGSIYVSPANEYHPTIDDGNELTASGDINNVLQYYWTLTAENITGFSSDITFGYNDALVKADDGAESDYIAARILTFNNPTSEINKFTTADVDETGNLILFNFAGDNSNGISGDYFAGIDLAIPDNVPTYTVDLDGNFGDDVYDIPVPGGGAPTGSVVVIPNGFTLTLDQNDARFYKTVIESGGVLEVDNTSNHRLGILEGTGTLKIVSDGINANLPAFSGDFLSCSGGGLEYAGTGNYNILGGITSLRNLTLSGSGDRNLPNNNITICEDLLVEGPTVNSLSNYKITINHDFILNSGIINSGAWDIKVNNNFDINGGVFDSQNDGDLVIDGDLKILGGSFVSGSGGRLILYSDFYYNGGNYEAGTGNHRLIFNGSSQQSIIGDFTGSSNIYRLLMLNSYGLSIVSGKLEISSILFLSEGNIITNNNDLIVKNGALIKPTGGSSSSYIIGKLKKELNSAGSSFTFPIGNINQYRPATINNVSTGGLTWEAQYFAGPATNEAVVDNFDLTNPGVIATIQQGEYWKISDGTVGSSGATATVGLSWGTESDVSALTSEREELEVMIWNDGTSTWDNLGGTGFSSGHTQSEGQFVASNLNSFSEHIYTLGSKDSNNPLPVELINFEGVVKGNDVQLKWITASELNNDYFILEHSKDGVIFEPIAQINGNGTTSEVSNYEYTHQQPVDGFNFYRLRQVDFDGKVNVEDKVISVLYEDKNKGEFIMTPFPNPTKQDNLRLKIFAGGNEPINMDVIDVYGISQHKETVAPSDINGNIYKLNINRELKPGIYIIKVQQGSKTITKRVMIND